MRRQLMVERKLIFERLNRLIRAVIDCKGHDRDSVGTKNALELARALAAESWEGRATQLTQVPNIGPAGMRKLASKDIRTVLDLADKSPEDIERLMSRQPPFGKNLQAHLERFPRLAMEVVMVGKKIQPRSQEPVTIDVKATLRYLNRKGLPNWLQRVPALTFLAESNDGTLVYFWRGSMKKLEKPSGFELKFSVGLRDVHDCVTCHFSCEEIVGTIVSQTLKPNLPVSVFPNRPLATSSKPDSHGKAGSSQDWENGGVDDSDLLLAAERVSSHPFTTVGVKPVTETEDGEYPLVEDLLEISDTELQETACDARRPFTASQEDEDDPGSTQSEFREPIQLPNGKWKCNHRCSGGAPTKHGKPCSHRCCREGIDKPRRRPLQRAKRKAGELCGETRSDVPKAGSYFQQPLKAATNSAASGPIKRHKARAVPSLPEVTVSPRPTKLANASNVDWQGMDFDSMDIECIDLSFTDDEGDGHLKRPPKPQSPCPKSAADLSRKATGLDQAREEQDASRKETSVESHTAPCIRTGAAEKKGSPVVPPVPQQHDYFDDDDFCFLDEALSPPGLIRPTPSVTPFKSGASDEVLYQGISEKFAEAGHAVRQAKKTSVPRSTLSHSSSPSFVGSCPKVLVVEDEASNLAAAGSAVPAGKPRGSKLDNEPDWVAEFDPEFVDMFRGYVTFV